MELSEVRRVNSQAIMRENAIDTLEFALCLGLTESQAERLLAVDGREIGEKLARQIEQTFNKPNGWMDFHEALDNHGVVALQKANGTSNDGPGHSEQKNREQRPGGKEPVSSGMAQLKPQDFDLFG